MPPSMGKKAFKSQASSSRAVSGAFGGSQDVAGFTANTSSFGGVAASPLSYVYNPPNLTGISDPNVIVAFKNVQKKDGTTKSKALEDLQTFVESSVEKQIGLEDAVLDAWIQLYPRTSIDSSRRVRQLAYMLQGQIAASCGKKIARYMPNIVGSWLAGIYDNDKSVSRASQDSFKKVFPSEEKFKGIWRAYQTVIIEYAQDVLVKESVYTLSDERTSSPDDASAKYSRTAGAVILMVTNLLENISQADLDKAGPTFQPFLNETKLWKLATYGDSFVRRAIYKLLVAVLTKLKLTLNPSIISANMLVAGLHCSQTGSSYDYVRAVALLSSEFPSVWTTDYAGTGKKSAKSRLCYFLRKGSQGGPPNFWTYITDILSHLPESIILDDSNAESQNTLTEGFPIHSQVLEALHEGIASKDEPRPNSGASWSTYITAASLVYEALQDADDRRACLKGSVIPILNQYLMPSPDQSRWGISGSQQLVICEKACYQLFTGDPDLFKEEIRNFSERIIQDLKTSLPEQSKDFTKSQQSLSAEISRWYNLQAALFEEHSTADIRQVFSETLLSEIKSAVSTLKARNGKPYGAAAALETAVKVLPQLLLTNAEAKDILVGFANNDIPDLLSSPSARYMVGLLNLLKGTPGLQVDYAKCVEVVSHAPDSSARYAAVNALLSSLMLADTKPLGNLAIENLQRAIEQDDSFCWDNVIATVKNPEAPQDLINHVFAKMTESLSMESKKQATLNGFELLSKKSTKPLRDFVVSFEGSSLLSKLLFLGENEDDDFSRHAKELSIALEGALNSSGDISQATESKIEIIRSGLDEAGEVSLSVDSLIQQARKILEQAGSPTVRLTPTDLLPSPTQWKSALAPFLSQLPNPSIAITTSFGGAIAFITKATPSPEFSRDIEGFSSAFRMAQYIVKLINLRDFFATLSVENRAVLVKNLLLFLQLADDNLSVLGSMPLWETNDPDSERDIIDFIAQARSLWASWFQDTQNEEVLVKVTSELIGESSGLSASAYYSGRAYSAITTDYGELHGRLPYTEGPSAKDLRKSPDFFSNVAFLTSIVLGKEPVRFSNELLSDLTGYEFNRDQSSGQQKLILINSILQSLDDLVDGIPQPRLVFFVKKIIGELPKATLMNQAEMLKVLLSVLPPIKEIYGTFWLDLFGVMQQVWEAPISDSMLPTLHSSLRLLSLLRKESMLEANDDLLDAWMESKGSVAKSLVELMSKLQRLPDESHQPRRIINEILSRQLQDLSQEIPDDAENLYPVLASECAALQEASFELLHGQIPSLQEQLSLEKALNKEFVGKLPDELLSLILAPPSTESTSESNSHQTMSLHLRGYLLSWKLTFDHWTKASYALQADYVESLREGTCVQDLLDLVFRILISSRTKPVDASKFSIESYTLNNEPLQKDTDWLLIHLYYLTLRHLPSLVKTWWRDSTSRQTNIAVEAWTTKHISPLITSLELSTIKDWAPSQATAETPLTVKVSFGTKEVTASIPIDEQTMSIGIRLPPSYPLARAEVEGLHRVGVPENKWNSWIRNAQGQITTTATSAGEGSALIDCLLAWRRNVTAAMKGQTECAICYSVVAADRSLPAKKCPTCKNNFHAGCLFRWFKSSNSSSCPLCRNTFAYS